jgi:hypothetical protein
VCATRRAAPATVARRALAWSFPLPWLGGDGVGGELAAAEVGLKQGRERLGWSSASRRSAPASIRTAGSGLELRLAPPGALDPAGRGARAGELLRVGEVLVRGRGARAGAGRGARLVLPPVVELA